MGRWARRGLLAGAAISLAGGGLVVARSPGLRASFSAAYRAFRDPALVEPRPPAEGGACPAGPLVDTGRVIDAAIAKDFERARDEDLDDPSGKTLASLTLPDLPVPITRRAMRFVRFFTKTDAGRRAFEDRFRRSGRYRPTVERALREAGLPEDLLWLAAVESGFNPQAVSPAGASGLFQFMPETAQLYGLDQSPFVDERRSIHKSADAAVAYLRDLYERLQRWDLALAAYNAGYDAVVRASQRAEELQRQAHEPPHAPTFADLAEARLIPDETANYVPQIVAFALVAANRGRFGLDEVEPSDALEMAELAVPEGTRLRTVARAAGVSIDVVRDYNPELLRDRVPPTGGDYLVSLPADRVEHAQATLPAYLDHEVLEAGDGDEPLEPITAGAPVTAEPLPHRPVALGHNRLPELEPEARPDPLALASIVPPDAKLPSMFVGNGVGWQRPTTDVFALLSTGGPRGVKGREVAIDKALAPILDERAAEQPVERFRIAGVDVLLRRDPGVPFVSITTALTMPASDASGAGQIAGEDRHTSTVPARDLDIGLELALARLRLVEAEQGDGVLALLRRRATAARRSALATEPYGPAWVALSDALFPPGSPLEGTLVGTRGDASATRDLLLTEALRDERAAARPSVLLVGDVSRARVEPILMRAAHGLEPEGESDIGPHPREERITIEQAVPSSRALYGWIAPAEGADDDAPMRIAMEILSDRKQGRLEAALVGEKLAAEAHGALELGARASVAAVELTPAVPHDVGDVEAAMDRTIAALAKEGPTTKELALAKALLRIRLEKERDAARGNVAPGAPLAATSARIRAALAPRLLDDVLSRLDQVTAREVRSVVRRVLSPEHRVVITTVPRGAMPQGG